jgi:hypothetical protein
MSLSSRRAGINTACPLPRLDDIPEVKRLVEAAKVMLDDSPLVGEDFDALRAALAAFADKGEEPKR